jgi:hypothetical protein
MDYSEKYLKYKNKYITLKNSFSNQLGGSAAVESSQPKSKIELDTILKEYIGKPVYVCGKDEMYKLIIIKPNPVHNNDTRLYSVSRIESIKSEQALFTFGNNFYILCENNLCIELNGGSGGKNHFIFLNVENDDWVKLVKNENVMNAILTKKLPLIPHKKF